MGKKILLVDDDTEMVSMLTEFLGNAGFNLNSLMDGEKVVEIAARVLPDLILMDIVMPKKDGWLICQKLKSDKKLKNIPVILYSGMILEDSSSDPLVEKCDYMFAKPLDMQKLLNKIKEFTKVPLRHD